MTVSTAFIFNMSSNMKMTKYTLQLLSHIHIQEWQSLLSPQHNLNKANRFTIAGHK